MDSASTMLTMLTMLTNAPSSPRSPSPRKTHNPASAACNGASNGAAGYAFRHPGVTDARIQTVSERLESPERLDVQLQNRPLTSIPQLSVKNQKIQRAAFSQPSSFMFILESRCRKPPKESLYSHSLMPLRMSAWERLLGSMEMSILLTM